MKIGSYLADFHENRCHAVNFLDHLVYRNVINIGGQNVEKSGKISRIPFRKIRLSSAPIFTNLATAQPH